MKKQKAFTLIELLVVIVIIGILASVSTATYRNYIERANDTKKLIYAEQVKRQLMAENAVNSGEAITSFYDFEGADDINTTSPYIIDKGGYENHLDATSSAGAFGQSTDTPSGNGYSLKIEDRLFQQSVAANAPTTKITLSTWMKIEEMPTDRAYPIFTPNTGIRLYGDGHLRFYINYNYYTDPTSAVESAVGSIEEGIWYHIMGSYNGDTETLSLWIDGELIEQKIGISQTMLFNASGGSDSYTIGYNGSGASRRFDGWVDDVIFSPLAYNGESFE